MNTSIARFSCLLVLVMGLSIARAETAALARKLLVREFRAEKATPAEVFQRLRDLSKELDPAHQGLNFFLQTTPGGKDIMQQPVITIDMRNIPLDRLVGYICLSAGLHYRFAEEAVIIADQPLPAGEMRTEVFKVAPGVVDTPRTRPPAKRIDWRD
jgi:hypothetical protein